MLKTTFLFFPLAIVIQGAVIVRTVTPPLPFRMWLYPLPSIVALIGWRYLLTTSEGYLLSLLLVVDGSSGLPAYILRDQFVASGHFGVPFARPRFQGDLP
jgi:hypothetical protein